MNCYHILIFKCQAFFRNKEKTYFKIKKYKELLSVLTLKNAVTVDLGDGIWTIGDGTGKSLFTHIALYQSSIVASDILGKENPPARYEAVHRGTFILGG